MNVNTDLEGRNPASLVMFVMMLLALAASQMHESALTTAARSIDTISQEVQSDLNRINVSLGVISRAGQLTAVTVGLVRQRQARD